MNRTEVKTMSDLPELPFEKLLSYLSLEDRLKSRAVSRIWYHRINGYKVKSLCFSQRPSGFIYRKSRLVSGAFARNFIRSTRFETFFDTFGQSILSNLKQLRLCELSLNERLTAFAPTLQSFRQLEELDIIQLDFGDLFACAGADLELNLPALRSIHLKRVLGIRTLTLDAPRLQKVKFADCSLSLVFVHGESVERLLVDQLKCIAMKNLKQLQYLYTGQHSVIDSTLLSGLDELKEFHLIRPGIVEALFEQKERYGRVDLKIYLGGHLLNDRDDQMRSRFLDAHREAFVHLVENPSRLADELPFCDSVDYSAIERVDPELTIDLLRRFTDLSKLCVYEPVQNIERFLDVLKHFDNIEALAFWGDQPQDLFDRLPEHSAVQRLTICGALSGFEFLFRLQHVIQLKFDDKNAEIEILAKWTFQKRFLVRIAWKFAEVSDLNAVILTLLKSRQKSSQNL